MCSTSEEKAAHCQLFLSTAFWKVCPPILSSGASGVRILPWLGICELKKWALKTRTSFRCSRFQSPRLSQLSLRGHLSTS